MLDKKEEPNYEALQKQWQEEVKNNPKAQAFLEPYKEFEKEHLYQKYAFSKMLACQNADYYRKRNAQLKTRWMDLAAEHLTIIQQKKLFDAQCKWRAGNEEYEGVEICYDFQMWERDVMNCPFIEQPTSYDIDLYSDYLTRGNEVDIQFNGFDVHSWQNYDELKEAYASNEQNMNIPEWYEFHNSRTGNGILLTLPDVKGKMEEFYRDLAMKEKQKNEPPPAPYVPPADADKLYLNYYDKLVHLELAKQIENKEMLNIMKEFVEATEHRSTWEYEHAEENFNYLNEITDELIPIEAHQDYRIALSLACEKYRSKKIAEHLPLALDQYQTSRKLQEMGIVSYTKSEYDEMYANIRKMFADSILEGRKLNNEPPDFNY